MSKPNNLRELVIEDRTYQLHLLPPHEALPLAFKLSKLFEGMADTPSDENVLIFIRNVDSHSLDLLTNVIKKTVFASAGGENIKLSNTSFFDDWFGKFPQDYSPLLFFIAVEYYNFLLGRGTSPPSEKTEAP